MGGSPWGTSNVMAKVSGIVKTNNTVYKDRHDNGFCVKMETHIEKVKVLGLININVLAAGSIFLGDMKEPITGTKEGPKAMNWGIKFNKRPKAIRYDYRMKLSGEKDRIKLTGFSGRSTVKGKDHGITVLFLQKRTEDSNGNITALWALWLLNMEQQRTVGKRTLPMKSYMAILEIIPNTTPARWRSVQPIMPVTVKANTSL